MAVNTAAFRAAMARVPTAVSIITTVDASGEPWGVTVATLGCLSFTPPLLMFCLDQSNASHEVFSTSARFLVHVLADHQADLAGSFARRGGHRFPGGYPTRYGLPTIRHSVSCLLCVQDALVRGGDHSIVIGSVQEIESGAHAPLLYHEHSYCSLERRIGCPASPVTSGSAIS